MSASSPPPLEQTDSGAAQSNTSHTTGIRFGLASRTKFKQSAAPLTDDAHHDTPTNGSHDTTLKQTAQPSVPLVIPVKKQSERASVMQTEPSGERGKLEFESTRDVNIRTAHSSTSQPPDSTIAPTSATAAVAERRHEPLLKRPADRHTARNISEEDRFKTELTQYADTPVNYTSVPIQQFGAAMLRGMGWSDGAAIGGSVKAVTEPVIYSRRGDRVGLGADIKPNKHTNGSNSNTANNTMHSTSAHAIKQLQKSGRIIQVHAQQLRDDSLVEIVSGQHIGLHGRVQQIDNDNVHVKLNTADDRKVLLHTDDIVVLDERALPLDHPALHTIQADDASIAKQPDRTHTAPTTTPAVTATPPANQTTEPANNQLSTRNNSIPDERQHKRAKHDKPLRWIRQSLVVRVINKHLHDLYNDKCVVTTVQPPYHFTVQSASTQRTLHELTERDVETVVPKVGGTAMVIRGEHQSQLCTVLERDSRRSVVTVQLADELHSVKLDFDDVCLIER